MDDELYMKLQYIAKQEERSYNKQVVLVLKTFVADYEKQHGTISVNTDELYK